MDAALSMSFRGAKALTRLLAFQTHLNASRPIHHISTPIAPTATALSPKMLTPKEIVATDGISGLKLSRNGSWVVYTVGPKYKAGDHATSALWVAETAKEESARKITSGKYQDNEPAFHPNTLEIFFLSDRHKAGGASQLYRLPFPVDDTDPTPVTPLSNEKGVSSFSISPDGSYVAFVSQDEDAQSNETAVDAEVWGEKKGLGRLRVIDLRNLNSA